jgi:HD-GYP domain-containing protein (c-di-GMP phosphodiesterase class II)
MLDNLRLLERLKRTSFEAVRALVNAIEQKDPYTAGHSERVGFLAKLTGEHLGLSGSQVQQLEWAGLLHDVGKIGIPEDVLNKPGRLTSEEYAVIKGHPSRSFEVLRPVAQLGSLLDAVLYHHENPDGSGYPKGLKGEEIPLMARIIHVVDVFDALTSTRSYREAFPIGTAMEILRKDAGTKLDSAMVGEFMEAWALMPKMHPEEYQRWFANIRQS